MDALQWSFMVFRRISWLAPNQWTNLIEWPWSKWKRKTAIGFKSRVSIHFKHVESVSNKKSPIGISEKVGVPPSSMGHVRMFHDVPWCSIWGALHEYHEWRPAIFSEALKESSSRFIPIPETQQHHVASLRRKEGQHGRKARNAPWDSPTARATARQRLR